MTSRSPRVMADDQTGGGYGGFRGWSTTINFMWNLACRLATSLGPQSVWSETTSSWLPSSRWTGSRARISCPPWIVIS